MTQIFAGRYFSITEVPGDLVSFKNGLKLLAPTEYSVVETLKGIAVIYSGSDQADWTWVAGYESYDARAFARPTIGRDGVERKLAEHSANFDTHWCRDCVVVTSKSRGEANFGWLNKLAKNQLAFT